MLRDNVKCSYYYMTKLTCDTCVLIPHLFRLSWVLYLPRKGNYLPKASIFRECSQASIDCKNFSTDDILHFYIFDQFWIAQKKKMLSDINCRLIWPLSYSSKSLTFWTHRYCYWRYQFPKRHRYWIYKATLS